MLIRIQFTVVGILLLFISNAQTPYFRVLNGIPHLPVFANAAAATTAVGTPETGMFFFSTQDAIPMYYNGSGWVGVCSVQSWTGGMSYFQIKKGVPFLPITTTFAGTPPPGAMYYSSTNGAVMVADGGNVFRKVSDVGTTSTAFTGNTGFSSSGSGITTFRLPVFMTPPTGIEAGAIFVNGTTKVVSFYTGTGWLPLSCGFTCGSPLNVSHLASGGVAPVDKSVSYGTVVTNLSGSNKCWITRNLGADQQAPSAIDDSDASAGWYWQFNRKKGYIGSTGTPIAGWITRIEEDYGFLSTNDPCALLLGSTWRLPTKTEWSNVISGWGSYTNGYNSVLKLHTSGYLRYDTSLLQYRGVSSTFHTSTQSSISYGYQVNITSSLAEIKDNEKSFGLPVRCLNGSAYVPAKPGAITGNITACSGVCSGYSILPVPDADSYTWTYTGGGSLTPSLDGLSCSLCPNGSGILSVVAKNANGSSIAATIVITINCSAASPILEYPDAHICQYSGAMLLPSIATPSGGSFTSDGSLVIDPLTGAINLAASNPGSHTITYTPNATCCPNIKATFTIQIDALPIVTASEKTPVTCDNPTGEIEISIDLQQKPPLATSCSVIVTNSSGQVVASGSYTITGTGSILVPDLEPGTYTCVVINKETGCSASATVVVSAPKESCLLYTVIPDCKTGKTDVEICINNVATDLSMLADWSLDVTDSGGTLVSSGNVFTASCFTVQNLDPGDYIFTAKSKNGDKYSVNVHVEKVCCPPTVNVTQTDCYSKKGDVVICVDGYSSSGSCDWSLTMTDPLGNKTTDAGLKNNCITKSGLTPGTYTFVIKNNQTGCPDQTVSVTLNCPVECRPTKLVYTQTKAPDCKDKTEDGQLTGFPSGSWMLNPGKITGTGDTTLPIKGLAPGVYYYTVTDASGCFSDSLKVVVLCPDDCTAEVPSYQVMRAPDCHNKTEDIVFELEGTGWKINPGGTAIGSSLYPVYGLAPGTHEFTFTNSEGCVSAPVVVTVECPKGCDNKLNAKIVRNPDCKNKTADILVEGMPEGHWTVNPGGYTGIGTSGIIRNVPVGTYKFSITDEFGCILEAQIDVEVKCPDGCASDCSIPTFTTTIPDCDKKTFDLTIGNLPKGKWTINPGGYTGDGGSQFISGLTPGVRYVYTITDADGYTATYTVFVKPPCCPPKVKVVCVPAGHDLEKIWMDHSEVRITGLPTDGCTVTRVDPSAGTSKSVSGTSLTLYGLSNGTYKYRMTDKYGCTVEFSFTVDCKFSSWEILRYPECLGDLTADIKFLDLPAEGWKIVPGQTGGTHSGGEPINGTGTTWQINRINIGDYTYMVYDKSNVLYSTLGVTIPYPDNGTTPSVSVQKFDPESKLATISLTKLPESWTINIGSGIKQAGTGPEYTFKDISIIAGDYDVTVVDASTSCISDPVTITLK